MKIHHRHWPIYLSLILIAAVLVYLGRHHLMQIYYNQFLMGLGALSLGLVLVAWACGGTPEAIDDDVPE